MMRSIGFTHRDLRLDFRKFACKICPLVCRSAENRMSGCVAISLGAVALRPMPAAVWKPLIPGVALSKKILDFGLGRLDRLFQISDTACVSRGVVQREEG